MENSNQPQKIVVVSAGEKSLVAAILLTLFFGPLGLFYASITGGVVMLVGGIVFTIITLGFGLLIVYPICIVWAIVATNSYNANLRSSIK